MFFLKVLFIAHTALAAGYSVQSAVDRGYERILQTSLGQEICQDVLGADARALEFHLGVSKPVALRLAQRCSNQRPLLTSEWISPAPQDVIRKLTLFPQKPRRYQVLVVTADHPLESWTEPFTNTTFILTKTLPIAEERLVQILAHETAVYFDSKANPAHPDAKSVPALRALTIEGNSTLPPLLALSNPLTAHALTFVRALQVEFAIVRELVERGEIKAPKDYDDPYLNRLISAHCRHACLLDLIESLRARYSELSLPFLAFAPHYRALALYELPRLQLGWSQKQLARVQAVLNTIPVQFLKDHFSGDPASDLNRAHVAEEREEQNFALVSSFLNNDLWPLEKASLNRTWLSDSESLVEFMKTPLLTGNNIALSSGPRVRIRTGNVE